MHEIMNQGDLSSQSETTDLQNRLRGLRSGLQADKQQEQVKLKKACEDFEAVFIGQLWKQMRASVPKDGMLHSKEEEQYLSMFDQELSLKMARSGGIGLSDMLFSSLSERLAMASRDTETLRPLLPLKQAQKSEDLASQTAPAMSTVEALTVKQQVEMLAQSIERTLGRQEVKEPLNVAQATSTMIDLDEATRSVLMDESDHM